MRPLSGGSILSKNLSVSLRFISTYSGDIWGTVGVGFIGMPLEHLGRKLIG